MRDATFSIAALDRTTGMLGVAVASKALAVGATCAFVRAGCGAIASQAYSNPRLGIEGLTHLAAGLGAEATLREILARDDGRDWRQVNVVDGRGGSATHTGSRTDPWSGSRSGPDYAIGGNLLVGDAVVVEMERAFTAGDGLEFGERLMRVLEAGDGAGGDRRGKQSAAVLVAYRQIFPYLDLRVDDHPEPIKELRRLLQLAWEGEYLANRRRLADTLQPRSVDEIIKLQQATRRRLQDSGDHP
ncbi:MAG TPA: DUF1028 domain-containing protein [Gemmatimonadales bacterium]|nr:DUF1028 domain-containing protein [Gemmatimonadales bacterium]